MRDCQYLVTRTHAQTEGWQMACTHAHLYFNAINAKKTPKVYFIAVLLLSLWENTLPTFCIKSIFYRCVTFIVMLKCPTYFLHQKYILSLCYFYRNG